VLVSNVQLLTRVYDNNYRQARDSDQAFEFVKFFPSYYGSKFLIMTLIFFIIITLEQTYKNVKKMLTSVFQYVYNFRPNIKNRFLQ